MVVVTQERKKGIRGRKREGVGRRGGGGGGAVWLEKRKKVMTWH